MTNMKKTTTDAWADAHLAGVTQQLAERMAVAAHERLAMARPVASGAGHPDTRPAAAADRPSAAGSAATRLLLRQGRRA